jgi:hypothetical protein
MSQNQQQSGQWGKGDKHSQRRPNSTTEIYGKVTEPTTDDDGFLGSTNLGLGNYRDAEYWQQMTSYRRGLFAHAAFHRKLIAKAVRETKRALAAEEWANLSESARASQTKRAYLQERGAEIWREELSEKQRRAKMEEHAGISPDWRPPHWKMLIARHEGSRSRGARLLDNLFGRVSRSEKEYEVAGDDDLGWFAGGEDD